MLQSRFSIIGIPAIGKSTIINYIADNLDCSNIYTNTEPLHKWGTYFEDFIKNQSDNELSFQLKTLLCRIETEEEFKESKKNIMLTERSAFEEINIFVERIKDKINNNTYILLKNIYNTLIDYTPKFDFYIYIKPKNLNFIFDRVSKRDQIGDNLIDKNYYIDINNRYEEKIKELNNVITIEIDENTKLKNLSEEIYNLINKTKVIIFGGNIGSGKTTLINKIYNETIDKSNIVIVPEKIDEWNDVEGFKLFNEYLKDKSKYSSIFQYKVLMSKVSSLIDNIKLNKTLLLERSPFDDTLIFSKMLYDKKYMTEEQYKTHLSIMKDIFNSLGKYYNFNYIYLNISPEICYDRMIKRNRNGEKESYDLDYIKELSVYQNNLINELKKINIPINIEYFEKNNII